MSTFTSEEVEVKSMNILYGSSMHSDILLSRTVTKLSRSMAVTTPKTICLRLGEPSAMSRGEKKEGGGGRREKERGVKIVRAGRKNTNKVCSCI